MLVSECYYYYATVFVAMLTCLLLWFYLSKRPSNFPPGPSGLPLIGYTPFLGTNPGETLMKMKEKYGPVMSLQCGREDWVILNDYDTINEALVKQGEKFSGRPYNIVFDLADKGIGILMLDYGDVWKALHKFGVAALRGFGVGKKSMEVNVIEEIPLLIDNLTSENGHSLHVKLFLSVSNIICRIIFGKRFEYDDKRFLRMISTILKYAENTPHSQKLTMIMIAPVLRFFPPFRSVAKITADNGDVLMGHLNEIIDEHESKFDENDIRDFIDAFLLEIKRKGKADIVFNRKNLNHYTRDLLDAGSETTSSTLCWALLCFCHYPECQEKIYDEIMKTLGEDGVPSIKYRDDMPYTCAFIQELMRHRTLVPLSLFHKTNEDATLNGYTIPKNTTVCPNLWAVHHDPKIFENPDEFRPEKFIDQDGIFSSSNHVIPFSVGPRRCLGEQLARMEIFIFLTGIVQKLKILPNPDEPPPSFHEGGCSTVTYQPPDFKVVFQRR